MAIASALLFALLVLPGTAGTDTCAADDHECRGAADAAAADAAAAAVDATDADADAAAVAEPQPPLRFQVGDIVLANMGRGSWKVGRIEHLHHREAHWPAGESSPYAIALDEGGGVYAPEDSEHVVRRASDADVRRLQQAAALEARLRGEAEALKRKQTDAARALAHGGPGQTERGEDLAAVLTYHAESCHVRPGLYAAGGQMDWQNQPDKFRRLLGAASVDLPRSSATLAAVSTPLSAAAPLSSNLAALGVLLHDAAGLTAWKRQGPDTKYSLRANPSSGALQPLEIFVLGVAAAATNDGDHAATADAAAASQRTDDAATADAADGTRSSAYWHYNAYWHSLERVAPLPAARWAATLAQLPAGAVLVALTSIVWRNAWKYGDPGFRYTHHDVGHQISSLAFAAAAQNASVVLLDGLSDGELGALLRADAPEDPVCLLAVFPADAPPPPGREEDWWRTFAVGEDFWAGAPPPEHHGAPVEVYVYALPTRY
jgi:hypothetical protein